MKTLSLYGVVTVSMLALASPLYATGDVTKAKDDANVKALTDETDKGKVGMGPSDTGKYDVEVGSETAKKGTAETENGKVGMGPSETGKYTVDGDSKTAMKEAQSREDLAGMQVVSENDEEIGQIESIYPENEDQPIHYVTLSNADQHGKGIENGIAVPFAAFTFENGKARLTVDESKLKDAPMHTDLNDENFETKLQEHYGVSPQWKEKSHN